jgi:transcriptional regulator with XRE-family HTH domain
MIFPSQIRAARALLDWNQFDLAHAASVGIATLRRLESAGAQPRGSVEVIWKIQSALENAGVEFIQADAQRGPGVRLRNNPLAKSRRRSV